MSRAGKYPIKLKEGVSASIVADALIIKGPKGEIKIAMNTKNAGLVNVAIEPEQIVVTPKSKEDNVSNAMWGTMARNIKIAVQGVTEGFSKDMYMKGVGYKASVSGNKLVLMAGYSHDKIMEIPSGISVEIGTTPTEFTVKGIDKNLVGQFADKIHKVRKPDPYKGKGIFYKNEKVRRKEGKKK